MLRNHRTIFNVRIPQIRNQIYSIPNRKLSTDENEPIIRKMPKPGKSTGDPLLDKAIKQWRNTNTPEDERFQKIYQKSESGLIKSILKHEMDAEEDFSARGEDVEVYVNPETGEVGGRKGKEPTRYNDWELNGKCIDF